MGKVKMDETGVQALKNLAAALPEATQMIAEASTSLESTFEELQEVLGPHTAQIKEILTLVEEAQKPGHSSVIKVQKNLVVAAAALAAIIGKNLSVSGANP